MEKPIKTAQDMAFKLYPEIFEDFYKQNVIDLLTLFFSEQKIDLGCPCCKNSDWNYVVPPPEGAVTGHKFYAARRDEAALQMFLPCITRVCATCGLTLSHDMDVIHAWWIKRKQTQRSNKDDA